MRPFLVKGAILLSATISGSGSPAGLTLPPSVTESREAAPLVAPGDRAHSFYFTRAAYSGGGGGGGFGGRGSRWDTDYPKADLQFLVVLRRLTNLDAYPSYHPIQLD